MLFGFIHRMMNTDDTSIAGQTIDFGPCAYLDGYDPASYDASAVHWRRLTEDARCAAMRAVNPSRYVMSRFRAGNDYLDQSGESAP